MRDMIEVMPNVAILLASFLHRWGVRVNGSYWLKSPQRWYSVFVMGFITASFMIYPLPELMFSPAGEDLVVAFACAVIDAAVIAVECVTLRELNSASASQRIRVTK